jgi:hypothetical protein
MLHYKGRKWHVHNLNLLLIEGFAVIVLVNNLAGGKMLGCGPFKADDAC